MTMTQEPNTKAKLYGKIAAVAAAVSRIPKNGRNNFHNYSYATESDITDGLRELLNANGLAFLPPSVISWERDETADNPKIGPRTRVQVQFALGCSDTGETYTTILWGEANDNADKGFYKAYTGAVKYYLMKTFLIATGDDPEQDTHPPAPASFKQQAPAARPMAPQKRPMTRDGLIARFTATLETAHALGIKTPAYDAAKMSDTEMIKVGTELKDLIELERAAPPVNA